MAAPRNLSAQNSQDKLPPLAERIRPQRWEDFQSVSGINPHLLRQLKEGQGRPPSIILWGPPGTGKTSFARLVGSTFRGRFVEVSAVLVGIKEVRELIEEAKQHQEPTILFVDEIHRFNKSQQDAFLPHIENGAIALLGATTENPSFYCTPALLSRAQVLVFSSLDSDSLMRILGRGAEALGLKLSAEASARMIHECGGDARKLLNLLESLRNVTGESHTPVGLETLQAALNDSRSLFYDRSGEEHYNVTSAFIKSLRGSDPDAALYWGFRMIEAGEDPRFVIRRMVIFASEDIGNADPRALELAVATADAFDRLGLPEGRIPIAQCITYLAVAPKSNRSYLAMHQALAAVARLSKVDVPVHLRNAPTKLMKDLGYGSEYSYPHDRAEGFIAEAQYLPKELEGQVFYQPSEHGLEAKIAARLATLRAARNKG